MRTALGYKESGVFHFLQPELLNETALKQILDLVSTKLINVYPILRCCISIPVRLYTIVYLYQVRFRRDFNSFTGYRSERKLLRTTCQWLMYSICTWV